MTGSRFAASSRRTLTVSDLKRSVGFFRDVVRLPVALEVPERNAAFLWVGDPGRSMLGLWSLDSAPLGLVLPVAFEVGLDHLLEACGALRAKVTSCHRGDSAMGAFGSASASSSVRSRWRRIWRLMTLIEVGDTSWARSRA